MSKKIIPLHFQRLFSLIFLALFFGGILYLSGFSGIIKAIITVFFYGLITYVFYIIWKSVRRKQRMGVLEFTEYFLNRISVGITISIMIIGGGAYYSNSISPTPMPTFHLSNGEKEVIFQAMSHIGTHEFYNTIKNNLSQKKQQGFVYYFEGVKPGTDENAQKFNDAIGIEFNADLYKNFSKLYGVIHQDNSMFLNLVNDKDYNVDLSIDEIIEYYEEEQSKNKQSAQANNFHNMSKKQSLDINTEIINTLAGLNSRELSVLQYINKGMLNLIIGSENFQKLIMNNFANQELFSVILSKRNEVLADEIINSTDQKIFITYGLLHFDGVFELLQKSDSNWRISGETYLYPIE